MPISAVELQEYLFSFTAAQYAKRVAAEKHNVPDTEKIANHIRGAFRLNRFAVMNWLMMNGVKIPIELLDDRNHPEVGAQMPDKNVARPVS